MITAYTFVDSVPAPLSEENVPAQWIHAEAPTPEESTELHNIYGIPMEYLLAPQDHNERPRIEHEGDALLILTRASFHSGGNSRLPFGTCPVAVILTSAVVITVCPRKGVVEPLLCRRLKGEGERYGIRLALSLLFRISTTFIDHLRRMDEQVTAIEKTLHKSMQNKELVNMLHIEKSLIYFFTALKGNHGVMEKLGTSIPLVLSKAEKELWDDVLIENRQAIDMAEIFTQIMGSLSDAFGAIVSNNLNKVMKLLTGMTLLFMLPSIVGALYGMNVALPFQDHPHAFSFLCLLCIAASTAVWYLFWKKDWL